MLRRWKLDLKIDERLSQFPIYMQIAETIIGAIQSGMLKSGDFLPGSRKTALLFNANRNTVIEAYHFLEHEGWVISKQRVGIFVADIPDHKQNNFSEKNIYNYAYENEENKLAFDQGLPDPFFSPVGELVREYRSVLKRIQKQKIAIYNHEAIGYKKLRIALSQMLNQQRRIVSDENNICITRGSQMALFLVSQCLLSENDCVIVEHPGYSLAWDTFKYAGATVLFASVDQDGILTSEIEKYIKEGNKIKAVYVCANGQFPTMAVLSNARRKRLIDLSNQYGFYIIEDDYCIDLNYTDKPILPLCSTDNIMNYVYIETFSRSVSPILKMGYMVGSHDFIGKVARLRKMIDISGDGIMERVFFNLIRDGIFTKCLKKSVVLYKAKRDFVDTVLQKYLKNKITYQKPDLGLGYWIVPHKETVDYNLISKDLELNGIKIISSDYYKFAGKGFFLSFGSAKEDKLEQGIKILAKFL
ncbi:GntR family transcriptional regulator / MocR family aminotransferase [Chryseobacterium oleae]|uniref:GntR family transcriptional regulator / MocR family aminotransferase n=1 Tax=Chryseobacterium oleae TaxID=491207 RepID=A0A1I4YRY5_CHROL|nr:PLP-dependent aminotransferase family protein [Chryseobacterium oleae]SFN40795.1 GntR family transcriptional regulator / MocR family aminotransferase [Chryseobacterium oleae]